MKIQTLNTAIMIVGTIAMTGCESAVDDGNTQADTPAQVIDSEQAANHMDVDAEPSAKTDTWNLYTSPHGDFSVMAPDSAEVTDNQSKVGTIRDYVFKKGEAFFSVKIHSDRKPPLNENSVEELKSDTSDFVPGSLQDVSLGDMPGIEFRMKGAIGESIFREYCAADNSRTISIQVAKDHGEGLTEDEIKLFLGSFKLLY